MTDERDETRQSHEDSSDRTDGVGEPVSPDSEREDGREPSHRVVDGGTSQELVILDLSVQLAEEAQAFMAQDAPKPRPLTPPLVRRPPAPPKAATSPEGAARDAADASPSTGAAPGRPSAEPTPEEERRARLSDVVGRDWERELTHKDRPSASAATAAAAAAAAAFASVSPSASSSSNRPPSDAIAPAPPPGADGMAIAASIVFVAATTLMAFRIEPFATWYYLFAWYPFLTLVNHVAAVRSPRHSLLAGRARTVALLAVWSIPVWMVFEAWNLRLSDWYYVGVPDRLPLRWAGIALSFATVLPGIFLLEEMLRVRGVAASTASPTFAVSPRVSRGLLWTGAAWGVLTLLAPRFFYPLVWGVPVLLLEPWLARRDPSSLLRRLCEGQPALVIRLLIAGAFCGLFWEAANFFALGKWIYTVPGFSEGKLFEMPFLGFVGFPPFALCCWTMARALVALGLLPEWDVDAAPPGHRHALRPERRAVAAAGAVAFTIVMLVAMDRWTVSSTTPRPAEIPGIPDGVAEYAAAHHKDSIRGLEELIDEGALYIPGESSASAISLLKARCALVRLAGIGTANARRLDLAGIRTIDELAAADPVRLEEALREVEEGWKPRPRRVASWVSAARKARPGVSH